MKGDKVVLVVDPAAGALASVMEELDELGFRVVWVPTLAAALEFLASNVRLSLIIASSAARDRGELDFLVRSKELAPDVRIIWGVRPERSSAAAAPSGSSRGPDSLIPEPFDSRDLRNAISELLAEHFYPTPIAEAIKHAALEVLGKTRPFRVEGGAFLIGNQSSLADISAVISFSGGVSGHLMVGLAQSHAERLYRAMLPGARTPRIDRLEDLVGEICNQILGRINAFFVRRALTVIHGTPMFIRAAGSTLRYSGRQPSFAVAFVEPSEHTRVTLEYYLADVPDEPLRSPDSGKAASLGEVRYL